MKRLVLALILFPLSACESYSFGATEVGALGGAAAGAGLGAIIGNQTGNTGAGIAIGSAAGALGGALIGGQIEREDRRLDQRDQHIAQQGEIIEQNKRLLEQLRSKGVDVRDSDRGVVINLPDVLFDSGKSSLTRGAQGTVSEIAEVLKTVEDRTISVEGHTDSIGTIEYNYRLSDERARSVSDALVREGLPPRQIRTKALGETDPIASNRSEEGRRRNRRVEVVILNPS